MGRTKAVPQYKRELVHTPPIDAPFSRSRPRRLFHPEAESLSPFTIQAVRIDWDRMIAKRSTAVSTAHGSLYAVRSGSCTSKKRAYISCR